MMKKILYTSIVLVATLFSTSCSGFLDEDSRGKIVGNEVLNTQAGLESALTGAYRGWANCWTYGFNNGWATEMTLGGDDLTCPPGTGNTQEYDRLDVKSTNSSSPPVFWGCYKAIQGANNVIDNYENTKGDGQIIKMIVGEAYFIRATSYFWLVRCHGSVPLILKFMPEFMADQLTVDKASVAAIYKQIEDDFKQAETMLGDAKRAEGRPNVGSAKAMLAEVYLHMAGWPLKDQSKYALAASKAKEVIDNKAKYGFGLVNDWEILYENDESKAGFNSEDIFVIPCNKNAGNTTNAMNGYWAYPGELGGWDVVFSELTFFNEFPAGPRKDATFGLDFVTDKGVKYNWTELKYKRPYYKKLMKNENAPGYYEYSSSIPIRMQRYTQTLLTYAEASARSGVVDALAIQSMKEIRLRAGLAELPNASATDFAKAVVQERAWELCGERVRWFDMVRLEMVQEVFAKRHADDNPAIGSPASDKTYFFSIPEHDLLLNPNLNK